MPRLAKKEKVAEFIEKIAEETNQPSDDDAESDEPFEKPITISDAKKVKVKRELTEKQKQAWENCLKKREEKRDERRALMNDIKQKVELEVEAKIVKKAKDIKTKFVKAKTNELLKTSLQEYDDHVLEREASPPSPDPERVSCSFNPKALNSSALAKSCPPSFVWC
jgi:hypothetical protein